MLTRHSQSIDVRIDKRMENNRKVTWLFSALLCLLGVACFISSIAKQSWVPLITFFAVLLGLAAISLIFIAVFVPLFAFIGRTFGRHKKDEE